MSSEIMYMTIVTSAIIFTYLIVVCFLRVEEIHEDFVIEPTESIDSRGVPGQNAP